MGQRGEQIFKNNDFWRVHLTLLSCGHKNTRIEGLFTVYFYAFWILNYLNVLSLIHKNSINLKSKIKQTPFHSNPFGRTIFFVLTTSILLSHLLAADWQQPGGSAELGHSPADGRRPLQPDTRPWHCQAVVPGLSDCILSLVRSLLAPSEGDRLMGPNERKRGGKRVSLH